MRSTVAPERSGIAMSRRITCGWKVCATAKASEPVETVRISYLSFAKTASACPTRLGASGIRGQDAKLGWSESDRHPKTGARAWSHRIHIGFA